MSMQTNPNFRTKGGGGCSPVWLGGCLIVLVTGLAILVGGIFFVKSSLNKMGSALLSDAPLELPPMPLDEAQRSAFLARFAEFETAVNNGTAKEAFALTGPELNLVLPQFTNNGDTARYLFMNIADSRLSAQVCLPADKVDILTTLIKNAKGKYVNLKGTFTVSLLNGRLVVFLDTAEIKGEPVSDTFMTEIRKKNLAEDWKNAASQNLISKLKGISIQGDTMLLQP